MASLTEPENTLESREDIPLKSGTKSGTNYCCSEDCLGGSRFINVAFGTLTVVITIALLVQIYYGDYQVTPHGSVATDSLYCSEIGTKILKKGGNAVDAAIASAFCLTVVTPYNTGLDAEGQAMIYNHRDRLPPTVIDFSHTIAQSKNLPKLVLSLAYIHSKYGSLPWKSLVDPASNLAASGFLISKLLVEAIHKAKAEDWYGRLEPGRLLKLEALSETLKEIANITDKEIQTYLQSSTLPIETTALKSTFNNYDIYVPNYNSIGPLLTQNLKEIEQMNFTSLDVLKPEYTYRIAELTDHYLDHSNLSNHFYEGPTSNVAVMDLNDNYVSLVMGLSKSFGSGEMTSAGYVSDNHDEDGPISSRLPLIITDGSMICGRRMVFGANDLALSTQLISSLLIAKDNLVDAVEAPRFHLLGNGSIGIESFHTPLFSEDILKYLETLSTQQVVVREPYSSINIVEKIKDDLNSHSDSRGGGIASRF